MYISLIDTILNTLVARLNNTTLSRIHLSRKSRAIAVVLLVLAASFIAGAFAVLTRHAYLPLALLGVMFGVILSYPATTLLGPKLQAALGGLLGGLTLGNIGSKVASFRATIIAVSKGITQLVQGLGVVAGDPAKTAYVETAIVYCIWMTLITMFLIVATNAYLDQDLKTSSSTNNTQPPQLQQRAAI
jgi:hypothetical protein